MAKTKTPYFSMGAHGTVGRSITAQKRASSTLLRKKPLPTDPKSDAQLSQRQIYRDAVAAWHALTLEEQQAWRGVCRGLTAYQCFLRTELKYVPPPPPPEEYTEEQTSYDSGAQHYAATTHRYGQRLIIPNRQVSKLGFWVKRQGSPPGNLTYEIRKISDDSLIASKVWGLANDLPTDTTYEEVTFDTPVTVNEEVCLWVWYPDGDASNKVWSYYSGPDVKPDEHMVRTADTTPIDHLTHDYAYRYKYYLP